MSETNPVSPVEPGSEDLLSGEELKAAAEAYRETLRSRVLGAQRGVATFFDAAVHDILKILEKLPRDVPWEVAIRKAPIPEEQRGFLVRAFETFRLFLSRKERGRYVPHAERRASNGSDIPPLVQKMSQGVGTCLSWKGHALFKSVYDFAVYTTLLAEVRPKTLFEIGAGTGASAAWLADQVRALELDTRVYSFDLVAPALSTDAVEFIQGDCERITSDLPASLLRAAPHPWVVIEDAHVNVHGVLDHFDGFTREGDYFVVEDSKDKRPELARFCDGRPDRYRVDTRYTDFFGKNCTTAHDSIFRRMDDDGGVGSSQEASP